MQGASKVFVGVVAMGLAAAFVACSSSASQASAVDGDGGSDASADATSCTAVDASSCEGPAPSFSVDVAPALNRSCNATCHAPGVGPWPLIGYSAVHDWQDTIFNDLENCTMPPAMANDDGAPLTAADRALVLDWIACGAPNN